MEEELVHLYVISAIRVGGKCGLAGTEVIHACIMFSQGIGSDNVPWRFTNVNQDFALCETYPQVLVVPSACSDEDIRSVAAFRSKGRLPVSDSV